MSSSKETKPNWEALLEAYGEGASDVEIARLLKITISRFYELMEEHVAFADFVDRGRTLAQAWWYEKGRTSLWDKNFNTALWNFQMKNRYGWADRVDTTDKTNLDPVNLDQAKGQLQQALKRLAKKSPELLSGANLDLSSNSNES
jgi:hypothetical protein